MINPIRYNDLGRAQLGWLDARHHFSFGHYYNPDRMGFGKLRVVNDDIIKANTGFDTHPHNNMEIITYVRTGAITHRDSEGNEGRTEAGDVQVMSAGLGIQHSEHNRESVDTNLYQIWIEPNIKDVKPSWDAHEFPQTTDADGLSLLVAGDGSAPLNINADAKVLAGKMRSGQVFTQILDWRGYLLVAEGAVEIDGYRLKKGDAAEISDESVIKLCAIDEAEVILIDVAE